MKITESLAEFCATVSVDTLPADVVARRLERSADNVRSFAGLCTLWRIFDSSTLPPKLAAEGREWKTVFVDPDIRDRLHGKLRSWI